MGRKAKILPVEILDTLKSNGQMTREQIAEEHDCCPSTIGRKVKELIHDGENIGFNQYGYFLLNKGDIQSQEDAEMAMAWTNRVITVLKGWAKRGNNHKSIAIESRKRLGNELDREERKILKQQLLLINRVVDAIDLDEELGE